jgi:hypothetical protein
MRRAPALAIGCVAGLVGLAATSCISSSVVASSGRSIAPKTAEIAWRPARSEDFRGLFESISIEGEVAASLWRIEYEFEADGTYSGAALVLGGEHPEFQTLAGTWSLAGDVLDLGDGQTARVRAADERLELASEGGTIVLSKAAVR